MTAAAEPRTILVRFPTEGDQAPTVQIGELVSIGQLVQAAWELDHLADDARRGQLIAQAQLRARVLAPVPPVIGGKRA